MTVSQLPAVNATLNATSAVLLSYGWWLIRRGRVTQHRRVMITAFCTSCLFLVSYLVYHAQVGSVRFTKQGPIRILYFTILLTHTILAAAIVPPSTWIVVPVTNRDQSDARYTAAAATSST